MKKKILSYNIIFHPISLFFFFFTVTLFMILHKFYYPVNKWWTSWRAAYKFLVDEDKYSWESSHKICRTIWKEFRNFYSEFSFVNLYFEFWTCLAFEKYYHHIVIFIEQPSYQGPIQNPIFSVAEEFWREEKRSKSSRDWGENDFKKICNKVSTPVPGSIVLHFWFFFLTPVAFLAIIQQLIKRK